MLSKMPVRKGSIDKSVGRKVLDSAKYVSSYLPLINEYNILRKAIKEDISWNLLFRCLLASMYLGTLFNHNNTQSLNPKVWDEYYKAEEEKQKAEQQHIQQVDSTYNTIFQEMDTLKAIEKYNIPYELTLKPSFKDKEKIIQQSILEKKVK